MAGLDAEPAAGPASSRLRTGASTRMEASEHRPGPARRRVVVVRIGAPCVGSTGEGRLPACPRSPVRWGCEHRRYHAPRAHRADRAPDPVASRRVRRRHQGPRPRRAPRRHPHGLPARPRPHRAFQGVPAAQAQDPGVHGPPGRPLPRAPHPYARRLAHRPHLRPSAAPQRRPHRGHRARPRPGPHAVRSPGRAGAHPVPRPAVPPQRAEPAHRRAPRGRRSRASTSPGRCATASCTTRGPCPSPPRSRPRSCGSPTASPTSTTTSTTRVRAGVLELGELPAGPLEVLGAHPLASASTRLVSDLVDHQRRPATRIRLSPPVFTALDALRDFMFAEVYLRESARCEHEKAVDADPRSVPLLPRPPRRDCRPSTIRRRAICRPAWPTTSRA